MNKKELSSEFHQISQASFSNGSPWTKEQFLSFLKSEFNFFFTIEKKKQLIGFILFSLIGDEAEIFLIAIKKDKQNQGYGELLLKKCYDFLKKKNGKHLFIEVRKSNYQAQRFYLKNGFKEIALRKAYYNNPKEDALIWKRTL